MSKLNPRKQTMKKTIFNSNIHTTQGGSCLQACECLKEAIINEKKKENPNLNLLAAYAALGLCFSTMAELIDDKVAITLSLTIGNSGKGENLVLMLGALDLLEKGNDLLIERIQQEIIDGNV